MKYTYFILILLIAFGASCVPTKNLKDGEKLLYSQTIKGNENIQDEELEVFFRQKPNRKILYLPFMPYLYAYYLGKKKYDHRYSKDSLKVERITEKYEMKINVVKEEMAEIAANREAYASPKKLESDTLKLRKRIRKLERKKDKKVYALQQRLDEGNWLMRSVGEEPVVYDSSLTKYTAQQMELYLHHRGYFDGEVKVEKDTIEPKVIAIKYMVDERAPYIIRELKHEIADSVVKKLVLKNLESSELNKGDIYNEEKLEKERNRLARLMQNHGYFQFSQQYIFFRVNDTISGNQLDVTTIIRNPPKSKGHKQYLIDEVVFETDVDVTRTRLIRDTVFRGIQYVEEESDYSKKVLDSKIFIRPDSLYRIEDTEQTQIALARLDIFKFVNINFDTLGGKLKASIFTSPYPKYQYSIEGGLNVSQSLPGPFVSLSFRDRNIFGGLDILDIRTRAAIEAQAGATEEQNFRSQEFGVNMTLSFPRILFPMPSRIKRDLFRRVPTTQFLTGLSYISRPEYTRVNSQGAFSYQWQSRKNEIFNLSLLDMSIINTTRISEAFRLRLEELEERGSTLINSFDRSFVSSIIGYYVFTSELFNFKSRDTRYLRLFLESGGSTFGLLEQTNLVQEEKFFGLRYFRFLKADADYRQGFPIGKAWQLATRFHLGIARPYGGQDQVLPYEKYFFTGGSNSNRAWGARRVGPGSFTPDTLANGNFDYSFEQPGEFILEANAELRRDLFSFFEGAFFVDAANVWTLTEDPTRPGSKLSTSFWKELAIGAGLGVRLDFDFLLIRFDVGTKIYDPARPEGERFVIDEFSLRYPLGTQGQYTFNLGIGYPF